MIAVGTSSYAVNSAVIAVGSSGAAIELAQPIVDGVPGTTQNASTAYTQNVTAGNTLVAIVQYSSVNGNILSVQDNLNNKPFTLIGSVQQQKSRTQGYYFLPGTLGGAIPTVTVSLDSSQTQVQVTLLELTGYTAADGFNTSNGGPITNPTCGPIVTTGSSDFVLSVLGGSAPTAGTPGWAYHQISGTTGRALCYLTPAAPGSYTASWTMSSGGYLCGIFALKPATAPGAGVTTYPPRTYMRMLSQQNMILGGTGASTSSTEFSLTARNNKLLGGAMASPADSIASMLSKQNKLLGGTGARTNENQYWIYVRTLKLLGGTAYPSDNVLTLLNKINKLI